MKRIKIQAPAKAPSWPLTAIVTMLPKKHARKSNRVIAWWKEIGLGRPEPFTTLYYDLSTIRSRGERRVKRIPIHKEVADTPFWPVTTTSQLLAAREKFDLIWRLWGVSDWRGFSLLRRHFSTPTQGDAKDG